MNYPVFVLHDVRVGFSSPHVDLSEATAKRNFEVALKQNPTMSGCPGDFALYKVGDFDTETGVITPASIPEFVCKGSDFASV